jgi:transcriptional regulator with XRE-family HTH domain
MQERQIGARIREARQRRGMNKNQLARALGTSWQHLDNWEKGRVEPSLGSIRKLAEALAVSADFLLGLDDAAPSLSAVDQFLGSLAPPDITPEEEHWLRNAPVDHQHLAPEDYAQLLEGVRQPASRTAAKSGARPKIDRRAIAKKIAGE